MEVPTSPSHVAEEGHRRQRFWAQARHNLTAYAFFAPILVFFFVFMALPVVWLFYLSFQHDGILAPARFCRLRQLATHILRRPCPQMHRQHALLLCAGHTDGVRARHDCRAVASGRAADGAALLRIVIYFPTLQASLVVALIWTFMVHPKLRPLEPRDPRADRHEDQLPGRSAFRDADDRDD